MAAPTCLEVFAGCYERTTLGYEVYEVVSEGRFGIKAKFTDNSHTGYVKSVAASDAHLATGSTDETIHLYDLKTNRELGALLQHDGSVTSICFHGNSHMISCSVDGTLAIWNTSSWELMKSLRAHKGGVNSVAVHPSGKLALTAGQDKSLRTWNLIRGRVAYTTNIKQVPDLVQWSPDGELYIVVTHNLVHIYTITTATVIDTVDFQRRIIAVTFLTNRILAVGGEGETVRLFELAEGHSRCRCEFKAHENRVKGIDCTSDRSSQSCETNRWLVTVSNDGFLKIWSVNIDTLAQPTLLASVDTTARLTCVAVRPPSRPATDAPARKLAAGGEALAKAESAPAKRSRQTVAELDSKKKKVKTRKQKP